MNFETEIEIDISLDRLPLLMDSFTKLINKNEIPESLLEINDLLTKSSTELSSVKSSNGILSVYLVGGDDESLIYEAIGDYIETFEPSRITISENSEYGFQKLSFKNSMITLLSSIPVDISDDEFESDLPHVDLIDTEFYEHVFSSIQNIMKKKIDIIISSFTNEKFLGMNIPSLIQKMEGVRTDVINSGQEVLSLSSKRGKLESLACFTNDSSIIKFEKKIEKYDSSNKRIKYITEFSSYFLGIGLENLAKSFNSFGFLVLGSWEFIKEGHIIVFQVKDNGNSISIKVSISTPRTFLVDDLYKGKPELANTSMQYIYELSEIFENDIFLERELIRDRVLELSKSKNIDLSRTLKWLDFKLKSESKVMQGRLETEWETANYPV